MYRYLQIETREGSSLAAILDEDAAGHESALQVAGVRAEHFDAFSRLFPVDSSGQLAFIAC